MKALPWFLCGVLATGAAFILSAAAFILFSANGFAASSRPGPLETWLATHARAAAIPASARNLANPIPDTAETLSEARAHWADHCASCHAADGSGDTPLGRHTWPPAPDMRQPPTQRQTDGELFFTIQNGVRFTAMPAWATGAAHDAHDSWKLVRLIRHLPALTADEKADILRQTPRTPAELQEEIEEQKFLNGDKE